MGKTPTELSSQILVNRVMSGKKEYRTTEYLQAFAKLSSVDLHHATISRFEIIKLWNSLQSCSIKTCYITFSLTENNHRVIEKVEDYYQHDKYAYICHDKDKTAERKHYHYVLLFDNPRSLKSIANDLELPVTMLERVHSKKGILDYLTHENDPNKYHYDLSEIHSNFDIEEEKNSGGGFPFKQFYEDYRQVRFGNMSYGDFIDKYKIYCATLSISGAFSVADRLFAAERDALCSGAGLSSRPHFQRQTPVSEKPIQTAFPSTDPNKPVWLDHGSAFIVGSETPKVKNKRSYRKPNPRSDLSDIA